MEESKIDRYFRHLSEKIPTITRKGKQMHYLTSTWDGKDEIYFLRPQDMHDML